MSGYTRRPQLVSGQVAVRQALGMIGYADSYQTMKPDFDAWIGDSCDLISPLKTYKELGCMEYEVCDNRIELPMEMALINCASFNGLEMTPLSVSGCEMPVRGGVNRCSAGAQGFILNGCHMSFKPAIANGVIITVDGLGRPLDDDGCPMIEECCILAISEYLASMIALRFRDNRYDIFDRKWKKHCVRARAELNQLSNKQIQNLGFRYLAVPYPASYSVGWLGGVNGSFIG